MSISDADTFGDAGTEFRRSDNFGMTTVAENQTFKFVVDYYL